MFNAITSIFKQLIEGDDLATHTHRPTPELAIAALLIEVSKADHTVEADEEQAKVALLCRLLTLEAPQAEELITRANAFVEQSVSLYDFTSQLRELPQEKRYHLIKAMWDVAHADGVIDPLEDAVIRKAAELLYVDHSEFIRAKLESSQAKP
ncbi:TerB family tellurite resistance protein [Vibrio hippocampi]|uniref:Co-chaperone DjlA N-terminal domain-containing protein n=1 Tax=Vibrio hippocampi TaxID=654686 RepID=A0ABN8DFZ3_9VIBR|nr:TerB family tellurite resistance protein [Vibrio hippocampi]CAH0525929.1 hypothetical protein VHP8226_01411 [Vibrio hippocampi]